VAATAVVAAAVIVVVLAQPSGAAHPRRRSPAAAAPARPTSTTPESVPSPPYAIGELVRRVSARTPGGTTVAVPVAVFYPAVGPPRQLIGAGPSPVRRPFPLVVFSPGYRIDPSSYDPLVESWVVAGYIVAVPTYPDTAPGAPAIESDMVNHPAELSQVITALAAASGGGGRLHGLVQPSEVAVAGQSDGGDVSWAAVDDTCCRDPRIKAAIILSGAEQSIFAGSYGPTGAPPVLVAQGTADTVNAPACSEQLFDAAPDPRYYLDLLGATHLSDYTLQGPGLDAVEATTTAFLRSYLRGDGPTGPAIEQAGDRPGVSQVTVGPATVPVGGTCLGAP
jgi:predicted dienelactone hydrolase